VPIGVTDLIVTLSSTREEEAITSYSCFSLGWGILLATGIGTRYNDLGFTSHSKDYIAYRAIEVSNLLRVASKRGSDGNRTHNLPIMIPRP
jgi:hypothetical protein